MRELLAEIDKLDRNRPDFSNPEEATAWNVARPKVLRRIIAAAETREQKVAFMQQLIDGISSAALLGAYPEPLEAMQQLEEEVSDDFPEFVPYVSFRRMEIELGERMRAAKPDEQADVQKWYLTELDKFIRKFPDADDTPTALWQLGSQLELSGDTKRARGWYEAAASKFPEATPGKKAAGALWRMNLTGEQIDLRGEVIGGGTLDLDKYRGKVVAVVFWATWSPLFNDRLPKLLDLKKKFGPNGFEVVGVNLDMGNVPVEQYIREQKVSFPTIASGPEGTESALARQYGIIQVPTILLVDKSGKVVDVSATIEELDRKVPVLLLARGESGATR